MVKFIKELTNQKTIEEYYYDTFKNFLEKKEFEEAYGYLLRLLHKFPKDIELLEEAVHFCIFSWKRFDIGEQWLIKLAHLTNWWTKYLFLAEVELELENINKAKEYLYKAKELQKTQLKKTGDKKLKMAMSDLEYRIDMEGNLQRYIAQERKAHFVKTKKPLKQKKAKPKAEPIPIFSIPSYTIPVEIKPFDYGLFFQNKLPLKEALLLLDYVNLTLQKGFDELLCLKVIPNVNKYYYQIEAVRKVLKHFSGRVLLSDEVGLGKTIEAGMLIKEYLLRGMIKNVLILTPASLVSQWKEEMEAKFGLIFSTTDDPSFTNDPVGFWKQRFIIASINTAKSNKNMSAIMEEFYDLVIVDEAHHLRNRRTLSWGLVNQIKKRFIFLLTATPVQNNLIELFNLITLLKPGQFKTESQFKKEYLKKGSLKEGADKEKLRRLLREVMIRNTRSAIDLKLPKRFATTMRLEPTGLERKVYTEIEKYLRKNKFNKHTLSLLLREAGSSPYALKETLLKIEERDSIKDILVSIDGLFEISKPKALLEILLKNPNEKKVIFTQFTKTLDYIADMLTRSEIPHFVFRGDMSLSEKEMAIKGFKDDVPVLVSTEVGGEGRNIQFCNTIINFDLPWNPMKIEQRIGRLHRIGQTRDVFIFNLSTKETIEDYIIEILDSKINMFEMVVGEIEPILGHLGEDREFEDIIMEIWLNNSSQEGLKEGFEQLGTNLVKAKNEYLKTKALDSEIFGQDYEM
ncbi:MAG: SNF2-related protein [bacterium]